MRILVASHTYIVDLNCQKLRSLAHLEPGIEVTVVVPRRWKPGGVQKDVVLAQSWQDGPFRVVPISNFSQNHQGLLCFGADLIPLLRQFRPQIIQVEQGAKAISYAQMITLNYLLKLGAKNLFFTWWNLPYNLKFPASLLETYNLKNTHGVIAGNQDGAEILRQHGYQGLMQIMPQLGVDQQLFQPQPQPELTHQLGIQPGEFVIGFVGRFVEERGLHTLLEAVAAFGDRPWKLLLLGRGPLKQRLIDQAKVLNVHHRCLWVESVPHRQVPRYINLMNVLVLPSQATDQVKTLTAIGWKEQFGHVLIEAMACRVPVIGSDSGEIPHVIGQAGLIFPAGDAVALTQRLLELWEQPDWARELAQRGYDRAQSLYTNQALASQLLAFYRQVIAT